MHVELSAMPLLADGTPLHAEPSWIGRYKMVPPEPIGDSWPSGSVDSDSASDEEPSPSR